MTVFVTTHFLEEAEYCDWVSFIDAGRLVVDAAPEDLRTRYSDGYRIVTNDVPEARAALGSASAVARETPDGLVASVPTLPPALLSALGDAVRAGAHVAVEQPTMPDVFRRVLAQQGAARSRAA